MTKEQAINLYNSHWWVGVTHTALASFQLFEDRLCMPFEVFHEAIEKALGRPVFTHEFVLNIDGLKRELLGDAPMPTKQDIINLIPEDKRVLVVDPESEVMPIE